MPQISWMGGLVQQPAPVSNWVIPAVLGGLSEHRSLPQMNGSD